MHTQAMSGTQLRRRGDIAVLVSMVIPELLEEVRAGGPWLALRSKLKSIVLFDRFLTRLAPFKVIGDSADAVRVKSIAEKLIEDFRSGTSRNHD
jgi:hypothetical protein